MYIKNIKIVGLHGISKSYDFTNHNYLFGRNGAGKSTVMQAIQFCLLGYIPGTNKTKDAILKHATMGTISVTIQIGEQEADYEITRTINGNGNDVSITRLNSNVPALEVADLVQDIELPIFNFDEFVGQTSNKLKDYFIKHILPVSNGKIDWGELLSKGVEKLNFEDRDATINYGLDLIKDVVVDINSTPLDQVVKANAIFKEDSSFHKSEIDRLQSAIDSLIFYDDYTGPTDIADIETQLLSYRAIRDAMIRYESAKSNCDRYSGELDKLNAEVSEGMEHSIEWQTTVNQSKDQIRQLESQLIDLDAKYTHCNERVIYLKGMLSNEDVCPFTKTSCESLNSVRAGYERELNVGMQQVDSLTNSIKECKTQLADYKLQFSECAMKLNQLSATTDKINSIKNMMYLPPKPDTDMTLAEIDIAIKTCEDNKVKLLANTQYNATIEKFTKLKYESELRLAALKVWAKTTDTNGLQTTLMVTPFNDLANKMTTYIQTMYGRTDVSAHFNVSTKANSFSFGLNRNGVYIPYDMLSSGEKCLYVIALMICITYNSKSPLKLIMIDDALDHLDDIAADGTFNAIKLINDVQFIMAGVKDCPNSSSMKISVR